MASPVAINQHLTVDRSYIVSVFPCNRRFREFVEYEHTYEIYEACDNPNSLIVLDTTPAELVEMLSKPRQD